MYYFLCREINAHQNSHKNPDDPKYVNICLKKLLNWSHTETKGEKHIWKQLKCTNKTTRFTHSILLVDSIKNMDRAHSNATQGRTFKSGLLSCIWISELLRKLLLFWANLFTVTLLMPPWCVIHSVSKPPVRLFIPLNHGHCSFIIKSQVRMCKNNWIWQQKPVA